MTKARVNADNASADIQGVTAGTGLTGGGTSGTVTLDVDTAVIQARVANVTDTEIGYLDGVTSAIQTQMDAKAPSSTAVTLTGTQTLTNKTLTNPVIASVINNTLTSTTGDIIYASSANTPARLGIGSSAQVLTVSGGVPAWATPTSANIDWVFVSTTSTTTGNTYTISGLGSYKKLRIFYQGVSNTTTSGARLRFRMNGDTGANYNDQIIDFAATSLSGLQTETRSNETSLELCKQGTTSAADTLSGYIFMDGCDGTGDKIGWRMGGSNQAVTQARGIMGGFRYDASAGISNLTFFFDTGNFDAGTISIYGSTN